MGVNFFRSALWRGMAAGVALALASTAAMYAQQPDSGQNSGQGQGPGRRGGGGGFGFGGGRGVLGSVTEVAADHYTIKTEGGEIYTVHFSANTRIMKQAPGQGPGRGGGRRQADAGNPGGGGDSARWERTPPQALKPTDIKAGDIITAGGEVDAAAKSVGAVFIMQIDPERAKQMREMEANFGKTWLAGRITAIDGTNITIEGITDHAPHTIAVDENTSFRQRRDSITLADIKPGEELRAEGSVKNGAFLATTVNAMEIEPRDPNRAPGANHAQDAPKQP